MQKHKLKGSPAKLSLAGVLRAFLIIAFLIALIMPFAADTKASEKSSGEALSPKTVRVGWYDSSYNTIDKYGRRSGYAYEYQLKLSAYNGWIYEYVTGSWPELLHMLETGEIDLMSDVSYTPKREENMLFSSLPMGTEEYYLFVENGSELISPSDHSSINGKKVGVTKDSIQAELFLAWTKQYKVTPEIIELSCTEDESLKKVEDGELDAFVTVDSFIDPSRAVPVFKIGASEYYFAVAKDRPDLLEDLDMAMERILEENRYYNQEMFEKYIRRNGANALLSRDEREWLNGHGPIRVAYQDDYLALCGRDEETGELTGVLKDYLILAADCMPNAHLEFEETAYPTAEEAMNALKNGEADCVFPANLSGYEAEQQGLAVTPPLTDTEMLAVVRSSDPKLFSEDRKVTVAVNYGNINYEAFLAEHYPSWKKLYYLNSEECLKAVSRGDADCFIISNYRYNNISRLCKKYRLTTFSIGIEMDYFLAVNKGERELYSILAKTLSMIPDSFINAALTHYITEDAKLTLTDFLADNLIVVLVVACAIVLVILILLLMNMRAVRKAKTLISATETDELTGLYNRNFFFQYANRIYREHPDVSMDAIVLNIEQFHSINALHGRRLGDLVLRVLGAEILDISKERGGIAGRFEADRFDIYCRHSEDYKAIYDRLQNRLNTLAPNANIRLRMGVMPWREKLEPVQLFDMARTACNMARGGYLERLIIYDEKVSDKENYSLRLANDLRHALEAGELEVFYQPKFNIQVDPPKLASAEALVRWRHNELGMISPGDFIPLFEKNGQIRILDKYVWSEAAKQISLWKEKYGASIPVSVNLSRVDVFDPELVNTLEEILKEYGIDHETLKLEVTESAYTENADQVIAVIEGLREKGFQIEMDDFGSGYSSLNMLSSMPIDVLKMDRAFIMDIEHDEKNKQLVELILGIARNLKVPVIAEGVETKEQLEILKKLGCAIVQGFYFSPPLPPEEFSKAYLDA